VFPLGTRGAGCSATAGKGLHFDRGEPAGQGGAARQIGATRLAVFTVVNAIGVIVDRLGRTVWGGRDPRTGVRSSFIAEAESTIAGLAESSQAQRPGNTTLTVLATNVALDERSLRQLGRQVHASMARAIQPFHTPVDGDVCFAVTTAEVADNDLDVVALGVIASELAWDAVLSSVPSDDEPIASTGRHRRTFHVPGAPRALPGD
jgi:L-aminopeptidase/D-esterase-like protein